MEQLQAKIKELEASGGATQKKVRSSIVVVIVVQLGIVHVYLVII